MAPKYLPYARRQNLLLIRNCCWVLAIHKDRISWKKLLENKEMVFKNWVKAIQAAAYNGARTIYKVESWNIIINELKSCHGSFCKRENMLREKFIAKLIAFLGKKLSSNLDLKKKFKNRSEDFLKLLLIGWCGHTIINCAKKLYGQKLLRDWIWKEN